MKYQAYSLTVNLKSLWEKAFSGEVIVINFDGKENASFECLNFWQALCNYRRKVRKYKLNPLYKDEWSRIERTKITRLSLTCFMIVKKDLKLFRCYRDMFLKRLPWNSFDFPISVTYL